KVAVAPSGDSGAATEEGADESAAQADIQIKTVAPMRLFYVKLDIPMSELDSKFRPLALRMVVHLVKAGGAVDGPLQIISTEDAVKSGQPGFELAIPTGGSPTARGKYRVRRAASFKCAYLVHDGPAGELGAAGIDFAQALQAAGYELTGESRVVFPETGGSTKIELQLGIR
ncbi:MAG: hypothetical protein DRR04_14170, partial [Gammaproteobacteria bacterium]